MSSFPCPISHDKKTDTDSTTPCPPRMCPGPYRSAAPTWVPGSGRIRQRQWNFRTLGPGDGGAGERRLVVVAIW